MNLLVRNRVHDYATWRTYFDANLEDAATYGLEVKGLWRVVDDPNTVFFILSVESRERAEAFMATPQAAETGRLSGVIDGDFHFVESPG